VASIKIKEDGSLGDEGSEVQFTGSGPNPDRQTKPYGHFISTDSTGKYVYACDLGTDHVWSYHFDPGTGKIGEATEKIGMTPPGSGPRHLAFGPGEDFAYVNGEMGHNITVFRHDKMSGSLESIQTLPLDPNAGPRKGVTSAEVYVHPSGKWLYVSSRGDDIMAVFSIGANGKLTFVQDAAALVKTPRGFGIDPTGKWLITAGQDSNQLAVLSIAQDTGKLTATEERATVPCPVCVLFAPTK
jgi:6-phosphogluconolactonase